MVKTPTDSENFSELRFRYMMLKAEYIMSDSWCKEDLKNRLFKMMKEIDKKTFKHKFNDYSNILY